MSRSETDHAVALIRRVTEGKTLVMVEHDMSVVFDLADVVTVVVYGAGDRSATGPREIRANRRCRKPISGPGAPSGPPMLTSATSTPTTARATSCRACNLRGARDGEIVSLLGRNGVGRSTTCKAIMGLVEPVGEVLWKGKSLVGLRPDQIAHAGIGYVPEDRQVFPTLTVRQNLELGQKRAGRVRPLVVRRHVRALPAPARAAGQPGRACCRAASSRC